MMTGDELIAANRAGVGVFTCRDRAELERYADHCAEHVRASLVAHLVNLPSNTQRRELLTGLAKRHTREWVQGLRRDAFQQLRARLDAELAATETA